MKKIITSTYRKKPITFGIELFQDERRIVLNVLESINNFGKFSLGNGEYFTADTGLKEIVKYAHYVMRECGRQFDLARGK